MPLTNLRIAAAKPSPKSQKLVDGHGLYLYIPATNGANDSLHLRLSASWRFDYRYAGKRCTLTLGKYPTMGLASARGALAEAKRVLATGTNPAQQKREDKLARKSASADSFKAVGDDWYLSKQERRSKPWREVNSLYLRRDLNPSIGSLPISQVTKPMLIAVLEKTKESRGIKTAERVRQTAVQVFDHAVRKAKMEVNPARLLRGWEDIPAKVSHKPLPAGEISAFMESVDGYPGQLATKLCIKLLLLTFVRKTELIEAEWTEIDLPNLLWEIPAERMKMRRSHAVPLSKQSVATLEELGQISFGSKFVFPSLSSSDKSMSRSTLNVAFRKLGYGGRFRPHGVRATASTWLNEQGYRADVIERQLAHVERNLIRAAYNNADYMEERAVMMQAWADFVDP